MLDEAPRTITVCIGCDQVVGMGEIHDDCPDPDGEGVLVDYVRSDLANWDDPSMPRTPNPKEGSGR